MCLQYLKYCHGVHTRLGGGSLWFKWICGLGWLVIGVTLVNCQTWVNTHGMWGRRACWPCHPGASRNANLYYNISKL